MIGFRIKRLLFATVPVFLVVFILWLSPFHSSRWFWDEVTTGPKYDVPPSLIPPTVDEQIRQRGGMSYRDWILTHHPRDGRFTRAEYVAVFGEWGRPTIEEIRAVFGEYREDEKRKKYSREFLTDSWRER